jgi:FkbM family methyltransferase
MLMSLWHYETALSHLTASMSHRSLKMTMALCAIVLSRAMSSYDASSRDRRLLRSHSQIRQNEALMTSSMSVWEAMAKRALLADNQTTSAEISCEHALDKVGKQNSLTVTLPAESGSQLLYPRMTMFPIHGNDVVSATIKSRGQWQQAEVNQLLWAMRQPLPDGHPPTNLFVDVGANVGWFSFNLAARGYKVESFEAMPRNQLILQATICSNKDLASNITLHAHGLGDQETSCHIFSPKVNMGNGHSDCISKTEEEAKDKIAKAPTSVHAVGGYEYRGKMMIKRLDSIINSDVKALKMDVEGFEAFVIKGASELLTKHVVWYMVMELNEKSLRQLGGTSSLDLSKHIASLGYLLSLTSFHGPFFDFGSGEPETELRFKEKLANAPYGVTDLYCVRKLLIRTHNHHPNASD